MRRAPDRRLCGGGRCRGLYHRILAAIDEADESATGIHGAARPAHVAQHEGRHATQKLRVFLDMAIEAMRATPALHHREGRPSRVT